MENQRYQQEDEIDLRDYINVVIKRKKFILSIFFAAVIASVIASFLMPKVYEVRSTIQLGNVDNELLIKKEEAREIILNRNALSSVIKELNLKIKLRRLERDIKVEDIGGTDLSKVKVVYPKPDTAIKISEAIVTPLVSKGQGIYQERVSLINDRLNELNMEIKNAEEDIKRTQGLIVELAGSTGIPQPEISLRMILLHAIPGYESNLAALMNQRNGLKLSLLNARDFKIFDPPIKPEYPIAPNKKLIVAAGILSLMLGVFLALFMEYWQQTKKKEVK